MLRRCACLFLFAISFYSSPAMSACSGLVCSDYIQTFYQNADSVGTLYIGTTGTETALSCTAASGTLLKLQANTDGGRLTAATLLAAEMANRKVDIILQAGSNPCNILYVVVTRGQ